MEEEAHRRVHHQMRIGIAVFGALGVLFTWRLVRILTGEFAVGVGYVIAGAATLALIGYQGGWA